MRWWSQLTFRIRTLFGKRGLDVQLAEEVRTHVEMATEANIANGMPPREARRAALLEFGNTTGVQERARDERGWVWLELLWSDIVAATRSLRRDPRFSAIVIITLALGIGATTAITSVVDRVLVNPVPGPDADRIVQIGELTRSPFQADDFRDGVSPPALRILLENRSAFDDLTWWEQASLPDRVDGFTTRLFGAHVPPGFFRFFGVQPFLGRTFAEAEAQPYHYGAVVPESAIMLSYGFWQSHFGGAPDIIGRTVRLGERQVHVVGVMPAHFRFPSQQTQFWLPAQPLEVEASSVRLPITRPLVKTAPQSTPGKLRPLLDTLAARLTQDAPAWPLYQSQWERSGGLRFWTLPLQHYLRGDVFRPDQSGARSTLTGLLIAIGFVLLIVCANIAHLTLARTERRRRELAVRAALGARRSRLVRQLLTENSLLALIGAAAGLVFAGWGLHLLAALSTLPQLQPIALDGRVLVIAAGVAILALLGFGLLPAWQGGQVPIDESLRNGGNAATVNARTRRQSNVLITLEIALAVTLLAGAGLMIRSVMELLRADPGLDKNQLLVVEADLYPRKAEWPASREVTRARVEDTLNRLAAIPGVEALGAYSFSGIGDRLVVEDGSAVELAFLAKVTTGQRDFLRTARVPLLAGRAFAPGDIGSGQSTVLVNETLARQISPGGDPVGRTFKLGPGPEAPTYLVVGVVGDFHLERVDEPSKALIFRPMEASMTQLMRHHFVMRTPPSYEPGNLAVEARAALSAVASDIPPPRIATIASRMFNATQARRTFRNYLCVFAAVGLVLAAFGIHSVLAYSVALRTREIGIRMALGADPRKIVRLIVGEGGRIAIAGIALGILGSLAVGQFIRHQLYGISPADPWVLGGVASLLAAVAIAACFLPARRASKVDPMASLRAE